MTRQEEIARYMIVGLPVPEELKKNLIEELCEEYTKERKGRKPEPSETDMECVQ